MTDITSRYLEAAILDQMVAGQFHGKSYAFVAILDDGHRLGVVVANEPGYSPLIGKQFDHADEAKQWANELNDHIGLSRDAAIDIVTSTMGGARVVVARN